MLSPLLFLLVVDWIMKETNEGRRIGIRWIPWRQLDDLDFADDIALPSHTVHQMRDKTSIITSLAAKTGLRPNVEKIKVMRLNTCNQSPIKTDGSPLGEVQSFTYLGSVVDDVGGSDSGIMLGINKARGAFNMLKNVWILKSYITKYQAENFQLKCKNSSTI